MLGTPPASTARVGDGPVPAALLPPPWSGPGDRCTSLPDAPRDAEPPGDGDLFLDRPRRPPSQRPICRAPLGRPSGVPDFRPDDVAPLWPDPGAAGARCAEELGPPAGGGVEHCAGEASTGLASRLGFSGRSMPPRSSVALPLLGQPWSLAPPLLVMALPPLLLVLPPPLLLLLPLLLLPPPLLEPAALMPPQLLRLPVPYSCCSILARATLWEAAPDEEHHQGKGSGAKRLRLTTGRPPLTQRLSMRVVHHA